MIRCLKVLAIFGLIAVIAIVVAVIYWATTAGAYEMRFSRIQVGMSETDAQNLMGSEGNSAFAKYEITGDNRQRVWVIKERGQQIVIVVVFDPRSRVLAKEMYKSSQIVNYLLKDL